MKEIVSLANRYLEKLMLYIGPVFVVGAVLMTSLVIYVHFRNSIPFYGPYGSLYGLIHLIISVFLILACAWNYFMAVYSNPGNPYTVKELQMSNEDFARLKNGETIRLKNCEFRYCKYCCQPKPERAHHCRVCERCILKFDHHCPWIANCVGHQNHQYFFLFLVFLWIGSLYVVLLSLLPFLSALDLSSYFRGHVSRVSAIFAWAITAVTLLCLSVMICWQGLLILSGQTTLEFYETTGSTGSRQSYDFGKRKNLKLFFGIDKTRYWMSWFFPFIGVSFSFPNPSKLLEPLINNLIAELLKLTASSTEKRRQ